MKTRNVFEISGSVVSIQIVTGNKEEGVKVLHEGSFDASLIPAMLKDGESEKSLAAYGLGSLLQDRAASFADKTLADQGIVGADAVKARWERYQEVYGMLCDGVFSDRKKGEGAGVAVDTFFAQALVELVKEAGKDISEAIATQLLTNMSKDERKAMKTKLASRIGELKADANKAASEIDLGSLLG